MIVFVVWRNWQSFAFFSLSLAVKYQKEFLAKHKEIYVQSKNIQSTNLDNNVENN